MENTWKAQSRTGEEWVYLHRRVLEEMSWSLTEQSHEADNTYWLECWPNLTDCMQSVATASSLNSFGLSFADIKVISVIIKSEIKTICFGFQLILTQKRLKAFQCNSIQFQFQPKTRSKTTSEDIQPKRRQTHPNTSKPFQPFSNL